MKPVLQWDCMEQSNKLREWIGIGFVFRRGRRCNGNKGIIILAVSSRLRADHLPIQIYMSRAIVNATATSKHVVPATGLTDTAAHCGKDDFHLVTYRISRRELSIFQQLRSIYILTIIR
jgi:hypothetical protein